MPVSLVWIVLVVCVRALGGGSDLGTAGVAVIIGIIVVAILVLVMLIPERKAASDPDRIMVTGGGFPIPPLDLKVPKPPKRRQAVSVPAEPQPAAVSASSTTKEATDGDV